MYIGFAVPVGVHLGPLSLGPTKTFLLALPPLFKASSGSLVVVYHLVVTGYSYIFSGSKLST
jgi:hypothetical protein